LGGECWGALVVRGIEGGRGEEQVNDFCGYHLSLW